MSTPLKFGLLLNGPTLEAWQVKCLEHLKSLPNPPELTLIVYRKELEAYSFEKTSWFSRFRKIPPSQLFYYYFLKFFFRPECQKTVDCSTAFAHVPSITCETTKQGKWSEYFPRNVLQEVRNANLDFILRFGFNIIRGEILTLPKLGVWSFHHGDEMKYRGSPAGFWEIYKGDPVTGAILQRLTERLDGGIVLKKGYFQTISHSFSRNVDQVCLESSRWPADVCKNLANFPGEETRSQAPVYRIPNGWQVIWASFRLIFNSLKVRFQNWFLSEKWNIGIVAKPISRALSENFLSDILTLDLSSYKSFYADPFGIQTPSGMRILAEKYDYEKGSGSLVSLNVSERKVTEEKIQGIQPSPHLSYPFLYEEKGQMYCIPESLLENEVALYRAISFPNRWEKAATLISSFKGVDATLLFHEGTYWLFATNESDLPRANLYLFFSKKLNGPFTPHPLNPVKTDIRSSRPAGTPFIEEGKLYRPAQDCSKTYGGAIVLNQILELSETGFLEKAVTQLGPLSGTAFSQGMHTLSAMGNYTLVDGKTHTFIPLVFLNVLKKRLG